MSTYTNSESIINVATISISSNSSTGTIYTCPAGRYAKIIISGATWNSTSGQTLSILVNGLHYFRFEGATDTHYFGLSGSASTGWDNDGSPFSFTEIYLNAGQSITWSKGASGLFACRGTALEFVKP
jgi:hypothetical protein